MDTSALIHTLLQQTHYKIIFKKQKEQKIFLEEILRLIHSNMPVLLFIFIEKKKKRKGKNCLKIL